VFSRITRVLFAITFIAAIAAPASAASYRYWGFFTGTDNAWAMSMVGAVENIPADGSVDGWRFGIGTDTETPEPRTAPNFEELCPGLEASEGITRVAVVIDFGDAEQAPAGEIPPASRVECVSMPSGGSSADALAMAADVRGDGGFVCGVDGFPAAECGAEVPDVTAQTTPIEDTAEAIVEAAEGVDQGGNTLVYAAVALVVVLAVVLAFNRTKK
jgi:hypothetical protein